MNPSSAFIFKLKIFMQVFHTLWNSNISHTFHLNFSTNFRQWIRIILHSHVQRQTNQKTNKQLVATSNRSRVNLKSIFALRKTDVGLQQKNSLCKQNCLLKFRAHTIHTMQNVCDLKFLTISIVSLPTCFSCDVIVHPSS